MNTASESPPPRSSRSADAGADRGPDGRPRTVTFEDLADGQRLVLIHYRGQEYRLTATKSGKLILNK
jgi:hemin uptake protein HemP